MDQKNPAEVSRVNFGIGCGDWGGHMYWDIRKNHMYWDMRQNPSDVLCAQEMEADFCQALKDGCAIPDDGLVRGGGSTRRKEAKGSPEQKWFVVGGHEKGQEYLLRGTSARMLRPGRCQRQS